MFLLSGTLKIEEVTQDQFSRLATRYFSSRKWKVVENENGLIARVGSLTDLLFHGYVFFCRQVEFITDSSNTVRFRIRPNWMFFLAAAIFAAVATGLIVLRTSSSGDLLKVSGSVALVVPVYGWAMLLQLRSVILRDLKAIAHKA